MKYLCLLFILAFSTSSYSQSKSEKLDELMKLSEYNTIPESIIDSYWVRYAGEYAENKAIKDSMKTWILDNQMVLLDSIKNIFDQLFTERDINDMLKYYKSRIGKKITRLTPQITDMAFSAGNNWALANVDILEKKLQPLLDKQISQFSYEGLYKPDEVFKVLDAEPRTVPNTSTSNYKSQKYSFELFYNPNEWRIIDCESINPIAEICFVDLHETAYSMIIAESFQADLKQLKAVALSNIYKSTKILDIKEQGTIRVNDYVALNMKMVAQINGISITYDNLYLSSDWGIIQMLTFSGTDNYQENADKLSRMNNGIKMQ